MASEALVRVEDLEMRHRGQLIQRGLAFDIRRGEVLAIVGASGSGKSTLLRHLIGLQPPAAGRVCYGEQDLYVPTTRSLRCCAAASA